MDFDTGSDPLLAAAVQIGAGALVLSLALLGVILLLRLRLIARLAHQRRFARRWHPVIAASVAGIPVAVPKLAPKDGALFLSHWLGAQEALRGGAQRNLNELAAKVGADRLAVRFLGSGKPRTEMLALVALGHLQLQSAWPLVESLAAAAPPAISIAAAQAMLRIDSRRALARVLELAAGREDWPLGQIATMLRECDANHTGPALAMALDAEWHQAPNGPGLARLLHLLGTVAAEASRSTVRNVLKHSSRPEVIAAALGTLWNPEDGGHARARLSHAEWYVRLAAVKALGRIGGAADVDFLSGMLSDPNWWVRYRAAKALVRLPGMSTENLERMRASADDRYAADMLGQVLSALEPQ